VHIILLSELSTKQIKRMNARQILPLMLMISTLSGQIPGEAQTIPADRRVDWTIAGVRDSSTAGFAVVDLGEAGFIGDGVTPNDRVMDSVLNIPFHPGAILRFPAGDFVFHRTIRLPSHRVLRGAGAEYTRLIFDLGGAGHAISVSGSMAAAETTAVVNDARKDATTLRLRAAAFAQPGDWLYLAQGDSDRVTSDWALGTTGQIIRVTDADDDSIALSSPLRQTYGLSRSPKVTRLETAGNVGIECLAIERRDDTAPQQTCNVHFRYAQNCLVYGIESFQTTFAHVAAEFSSNISVHASYMHHAFDYGGGGRGHGVVFHLGTGESRADDNIFEHLRHSMLVQAGANGNVFAYNYSTDPYWDSGNPLIPADAAGDIVMHGNYTYANLFEHNICQNIVIDDSHGPNGPYNTLFRNRAESYGIFFSASNSPSANIVGNEVPNTAFPYSLVNYTIRGDNHFLHGNNNKGSIVPAGSDNLADTSYSYVGRPLFLQGYSWPSIGVPFAMNAGSIPAANRFDNDEIFAYSCLGGGVSSVRREHPQLPQVSIYPNPTEEHITIRIPAENRVARYYIVDVAGRQRLAGSIARGSKQIVIASLPKGSYYCVLPSLGIYRFLKR
jgi:hypothetical protein